MVSNQIPELFFSAFLKVLAVESSSCRAFRDTAEKEELINLKLNALVFQFHFYPSDINISLGKNKKIFET